MRPGRFTSGGAARFAARPLPKAMVDEPEALQLFLKRGRENAERLRGAFLIAAGREKDGGNEIALEVVEDVP